jgi:inosine-uridine nucleoside N-ribohydrolase
LALSSLIFVLRYTLEMTIIIDTDVGYDDLLAILYLMNCPNITIEAFTVVNGISTVTDGANALLSLQEMLGMTKHPIPVYLGADASQQAFALPAAYQGEAKALGWALPTRLKAETLSAGDYLNARFLAADATVLAIGPLTNLAAALPSVSTAQVITVYAMGGAFKVNGDLPTPAYPSDVEANFYVDPAAAATVMANAPRCYLVPLDACDQVPITTDFVTAFEAIPDDDQKPNYKPAAEILKAASDAFDAPGEYYAWDELAAMALNWNNVLSDMEQSAVAVEQVATGNTSPGKTTISGAGYVAVAYNASSKIFNDAFLAAFSK